MTDWPSTVPFCKVGEFEVGKVRNFVEEETESGHTDKRLNSNRLLDTLSNLETPRMNATQVETFWEWYLGTLSNGAGSFNARRFRNASDGSTVMKTYMFVGDHPRERRVGPNQYKLIFNLQEV